MQQCANWALRRGEKDAGNRINREFGIGRNLLSLSLLRFYAARVSLHRNCRLDEPSITNLLYGTPTVQHVIWTSEHLLQCRLELEGV